MHLQKDLKTVKLLFMWLFFVGTNGGSLISLSMLSKLICTNSGCSGSKRVSPIIDQNTVMTNADELVKIAIEMVKIANEMKEETQKKLKNTQLQLIKSIDEVEATKKDIRWDEEMLDIKNKIFKETLSLKNLAISNIVDLYVEKNLGKHKNYSQRLDEKNQESASLEKEIAYSTEEITYLKNELDIYRKKLIYLGVKITFLEKEQAYLKDELDFMVNFKTDHANMNLNRALGRLKNEQNKQFSIEKTHINVKKRKSNCS